MRAPASQPEVATFGLCVFRSRASLARVALPRRFRRPLRPHLPRLPPPSAVAPLSIFLFLAPKSKRRRNKQMQGPVRLFPFPPLLPWHLCALHTFLCPLLLSEGHLTAR